MSRPSASMSTVKGFSLTFDDLAAFANHVLYSPPAAVRDTPSAGENTGRRPSHTRAPSAFLLPDPNTSRPSRGHRYSTSSTSSMSSTSTSSTTGSWYTSQPPQSRHSPTSPTANSFSPPSSPYSSRQSSGYTARPRRLTEKERAALANYTEPEMDIADMAAAYRDGGMSFEPLR